jgi:hypothetical protein
MEARKSQERHIGETEAKAMNLEIVRKMGKRAFTQSLNPYKGVKANKAFIFGLDTEFVPHTDKVSELLSWQLAGDTEVKFITRKPLSIDNLCAEALKMVNENEARTLVFVCYFSLAEIQFFKLSEWQLSEFKGRYRLKQNYGLYEIMVVDLADWYPFQKLENVAKLWSLEKMDYPIKEKIEAIEAGELTKKELLTDLNFIAYAKNDAVITQKIYVQMREYFFKFGVDIVRTLTPAATSASMFRMNIKTPIGQRDTVLRTTALQCCWGGRMESLFRGTEPMVYEYDATAHHPSSAISLGVLPEEKDWKRTQNVSTWLSSISGGGKVYFKFPKEEMFPCLPIMMEDALVYVREGVSNCSVSEVRLARKLKARLVLIDGYYYNSGTTVLTEYLRTVQNIRNKSTDQAQRDLLKLLSNSIIGKFFQKNSGIDLRKVQKYADEQGIPYNVAIKVKGVDFGEGEVSVGSCFYPEWYFLILGYARASISEVARMYNALVISSDSFVTKQNLGEHFEFMGIRFNLKASGELVAYRTRFYRVGEKIAHHAVHNKKAAEEVLSSFREELEFGYVHSRILHLRESWQTKKPFGSRIERNMTTSLGFDFKRKLLPDGTTEPWNSVEERQAFMEGSPVEVLQRAGGKDENGN